MFLKRYYFFLFFILADIPLSAMKWITEPELAMEHSLQSGKLILVYFTATWCKPCKEFEATLWQNDAVNRVQEHFINLKLDYDNYSIIASSFKVQYIPQLVVIDAFKNEIIRFNINPDPSKMVELLLTFPTDLMALYSAYNAYQEDKKEFRSIESLAVQYQTSAMKSEDKVRTHFLTLSDRYFHKALKLNTINEQQSQNIKIQLQMNALLKSNFNDIELELLKIQEHKHLSEENRDYSDFVLCFYYIKTGVPKKAELRYNKLLNQSPNSPFIFKY